MRIARLAAAAALGLLALTLLDAVVAQRGLLEQLRPLTLATAPLNALVHLGTPPWLRRRLARDGGIMRSPSARLFPSVQLLRDALPEITREAAHALVASRPINKDLFFAGIADDGWRRFYLKWYGPIDPQARALCPRTCALLDAMPEVHLAMFSILLPRSRIKPHGGPARMCLRYHLGVSTPNSDDCFIQVGDERYSWRDGQDVMFDDTRVHFVQNNTDLPRIVLFLDVERPQAGLLRHVTRALIKYAGPLTTRANSTQEVAARGVTPPP
jgi:beta-hydroxylase